MAFFVNYSKVILQNAIFLILYLSLTSSKIRINILCFFQNGLQRPYLQYSMKFSYRYFIVLFILFLTIVQGYINFKNFTRYIEINSVRKHFLLPIIDIWTYLDTIFTPLDIISKNISALT